MIFLTYGQPKSASTFLYKLCRSACSVKGSDQAVISARISLEELGVRHGFWGGPLSSLGRVVEALEPGEYLSIKTHSPLYQLDKDLLTTGKVVPLITYRDPGDAALSAHEAGQHRIGPVAIREPAWQALDTHLKAIDLICGHVNTVTIPWLKSGYGKSWSYDQITQHPQGLLDYIAPLLGISPTALHDDPAIAALVAGRSRVYNFNRGISGRSAEVFSPEEQARLQEKCREFIAFCKGEIGLDELTIPKVQAEK